MKGKPKPFLRNSEIDELCERLIYEYMGDDGAGKPVDIIGFTTGFLKLTILYTKEDFAKMMSVQECQADRGAAALLMPKSLLLQTCMQFNNGKPIAVYGNSVFTAADRAVLFEIAEYLRVSFTALVIRMEHLKLFEKHDFSEYVSSELHLGNSEAYG